MLVSLHFIFLLLSLALSSSLIAKPGCQTQCGDLSIPFPFGVGSDCSLGPSFNIICNTSTSPPKAYLPGITYFMENDTEVIEIKQSQIRVKFAYPLARACYNKSGYPHNRTEEPWTGISLGDQYTFSDENWLTAIGCDDLVLLLGYGNESLSGGCVSYCARKMISKGVGSCPNSVNGYSAGNGCCRSPIPRGTTELGAKLTDLSGQWERTKPFPCSYAFVEEKGFSNQSEFSYSLSYLDYSTALAAGDWRWRRGAPPVVRLDWSIGAENCSQAQLNFTTYACRAPNSYCVDIHTAFGGYLCNCSRGYEGNPYLTEGCQDINECVDKRTNPCRSNSICTNIPGSVFCSCPKGYQGDGRKNGRGCIPSKTINILIGLGSGLGFLLLLLICFCLYKVFQNRKNKRQKQKFFKRNGGLLLQQQSNESTLGKTKLFPAKELEIATGHFNESRILGQGGQGTVYKGMLSDGKIVAVKKLKLVDEDQLEQFINEVMILSQINHRNVVKLLGCCLEIEVPLLVYEFVPNGTLFDLIHDPNTELPISWEMRLKIAADIAGALAYLHYASSVPIYHRDIKSSNILLDEKYIVKVSDFGTSKLVAVDQTHLTTLVKGTFGYLDPEYFQSSQFTEKSDVYSFGVVLVELLTGQRPISLKKTDERSLATQFLASMEENNLDTILDSQVSKQGGKEEVIAVATLAQRCLNLKGKMRPTMKEVVTELESCRISQMTSTVKEKTDDARMDEAKPVMISDIDYTWTTSGNSVASSSSDTHPLMFPSM